MYSNQVSPDSRLRPQDNVSLYQGSKWTISEAQFNTLHARTITQQNITNVQGSTSPQDSLERLLKEVAASAFHSSAQRVDPPRCHANTRTAILDILKTWTITKSLKKDVMWLHGAAGAGKSAIAQSTAELCTTSQVTVASFFFFRTDTTRNHVRPLIPTLVYQLMVLVPTIRPLILDIIEHDPLIFEKGLDEQIRLLIVEPFQHLEKTQSLRLPVLLLIDGLDECNGKDIQANIIHTFSNGIRTKTRTQFRVLVSSRAEPHLVMTFNTRTISCSLERMPLDDKYLPDNDIRRFVDDHFALIHEGHPLAHLLDPDWPTTHAVDHIIAKTSGQFIYASVVMKYVSSPRAHPAKSLEIIRGLLPPRSTAPFAQLDALYAHIFSEVEDLDSAQPILAMALLATRNNSRITLYLDLMLGDLEALLSDLTSVIHVDYWDVSFLHASLSDFLFDEVRSQKYYLSASGWAERLSRMLLKRMREQKPTDLTTLKDLLKQADPTPNLEQDLLELEPAPRYRGAVDDASELLSVIASMKFETVEALYHTQLVRWVRFFKSSGRQIKDVTKGGQHQVQRALTEIAKGERGQVMARLENTNVDSPTNNPQQKVPKPLSERLPESDASANSRTPRGLLRERAPPSPLRHNLEYKDDQVGLEASSPQGPDVTIQRAKQTHLLKRLADAMRPFGLRRKHDKY